MKSRRTSLSVSSAHMWQVCYAGLRGARRNMANNCVRMSTSNVELRFCSTKSMAEYPADHQAIIPPPTPVDASRVSGWIDGDNTDSPSRERQIFCNRTIDMGQMEAIGFDMVRDYDLCPCSHNYASTMKRFALGVRPDAWSCMQCRTLYALSSPIHDRSADYINVDVCKMLASLRSTWLLGPTT